MAIIKCKMCGGDLDLTEGATTAECEFCGSIQTIPTVQDENLQGLFNRANILRRKSEFDKAEQIYEKIVQLDSTQAEAYWGLILCKFGIEYVEDPSTFKRVPTCHRTLLDSIIADEDYKAALENADLLQRRIYEAEAKEIDRLQKEIIALSQKEEPYDVFICYKESDESGKRTQDSVVANEIYYQLTQEGLKVFYAAITLEGKLGSAYEPCIFAALNSAKVMLVIGTRPEYFNAIWVKNEWSRFLKMMKADRSKLLIPCYRDMDAYELPEEFAHLQAQDMSKIGFINDVVRGIKKVTQKEEAAEPVKETVVVSGGNANAAPLLKRAKMFLEDCDWSAANEYAEKVLDMDPECAEAYTVKLCAELKLTEESKLARQHSALEKHNNFQKAMRFATADYRTVLTQYSEAVKENMEEDRKADLYTKALSLYHSNNHEDVLKAKPKFASLSGYKDAEYLAGTCDERAETVRKDGLYAKGLKLMAVGYDVDSQRAALKLFEAIPGWKDADDRAEYCTKKIAQLEEDAERKRKNDIYQKAQSALNKKTIYSVRSAKEQFESIPGWHDADEKAREAAKLLAELEEKAELERQEKERLAAEKKKRQEQINSYKKKYPQIHRLEQLNREIPLKEEKLVQEVQALENTRGTAVLWCWGLGQGALGAAVLEFATGIGLLNLFIGVVVLIVAVCANGKRKLKAQVRDTRWELQELQRERKELEGQVPAFEAYVKTLEQKQE